MRIKAKKPIPEINELKAELSRVKYKTKYVNVLKSTIYTLVVVAAFAVLVATLWMPVLQIYGSSMTPTIDEGQIVISVKGKNFEQGDLVAFYIGNKLLVKRIIACPSDYVLVDENGTVFVNGTELYEPYVSEKSFGECDIEYPYQVPDSKYFLMGDHRETSVDSRVFVVGCIPGEPVVGKIVFRVWPVSDFGIIE